MSEKGEVIVFGGSGGIGSAVAKQLKEQGLQPVLVARNEERLVQVASEIGCDYVVCDVSEETSVSEAIKAIVEKYSVVGAVVSIGSILLKPAHQTSLAEFNQTILQNLTVPFLVLKYLTPHLRATGGSIVLFSSAAAQIGLANHEAISAAKGGVIGLMRAASATYAGSGIRVNCVAPGLVKTPLTARLTSSEAAEKASLAFHPLSRLGEPKDIAPLTAWLVSPESSWVTGQVFTIDGGLSGLKVNRQPS